MHYKEMYIVKNRIIKTYKCTGYAKKFIDQKGFGQNLGTNNAQNRESEINLGMEMEICQEVE